MRSQEALRAITLEDCDVTVTPEEEDIEPDGQFTSDDPEADKRTVDEIEARRRGGDPWAWFCAKVSLKCGPLEASIYLGCCSYKDEADFKAGGCFEDMVADCLEELNAQLDEIKKKLGV